MSIFKLGIAGTHSTGKTTFMEKLEDYFQQSGYRVARIGDIATEARSHGFPILHNHSFESTLWIMVRGIALELEASLKVDIILVDRPIADALGYLIAALRVRNEMLSDNETNYLYNLVENHSRTYNLIIKTVMNPDIPLGTNKNRDSDFLFRTYAAEGIDTVLSQLNIPYMNLDMDNNKTQREIVHHFLNRK